MQTRHQTLGEQKLMHQFIMSVIYNCAPGFWNGKVYADSEPQIQEEHAVFPIYTLHGELEGSGEFAQLVNMCLLIWKQHLIMSLVVSYGWADPQENWPEMGGLPSAGEKKAQVEEDKYLIS